MNALSLIFLVSSYCLFSFVIVSIKEKKNSTDVNCICLFSSKPIDKLKEDKNRIFNLANYFSSCYVFSHIENYSPRVLLSLQIIGSQGGKYV